MSPILGYLEIVHHSEEGCGEPSAIAHRAQYRPVQRLPQVDALSGERKRREIQRLRQVTDVQDHCVHAQCEPDIELGHWVTGSIGHLSRPGHRVIILTRCDTRLFPFSKKCPKCKTYIWNAEMTKVIVRCLLLDWNHWMPVHAMNFYFCLWLLKILWPENTSSHISRHLEFIVEQGHRVNWVSGSLDSRVTGSLGQFCDPVPSLVRTRAKRSDSHIRAKRRIISSPESARKFTWYTVSQ